MIEVTLRLAHCDFWLDSPTDWTRQLAIQTPALEAVSTESVVAGEEAGLPVRLVTEEAQQGVPLPLLTHLPFHQVSLGGLEALEHPSRHFELGSLNLTKVTH